MKRFIGIILLGVAFFTSLLLYLKYDTKGYYYGFGCTFCNNTLPYNVKPKYIFDYPQSFVLLDDDGYELAGSGFSYETTNFKIKDVLDYGYNDTSIVVKCTDSTNNVRYLMSYKTGYKSKRGNPEVSFKDFDFRDFKKASEYYHWIDLDNQKGDRIRLYKTWSFVGSLVSLFLIARTMFRFRKVKAT